MLGCSPPVEEGGVGKGVISVALILIFLIHFLRLVFSYIHWGCGMLTYLNTCFGFHIPENFFKKHSAVAFLWLRLPSAVQLLYYIVRQRSRKHQSWKSHPSPVWNDISWNLCQTPKPPEGYRALHVWQWRHREGHLLGYMHNKHSGVKGWRLEISKASILFPRRYPFSK